jgi:hypothetical protein
VPPGDVSINVLERAWASKRETVEAARLVVPPSVRRQPHKPRVSFREAGLALEKAP